MFQDKEAPWISCQKGQWCAIWKKSHLDPHLTPHTNANSDKKQIRSLKEVSGHKKVTRQMNIWNRVGFSRIKNYGTNYKKKKTDKFDL